MNKSEKMPLARFESLRSNTPIADSWETVCTVIRSDALTAITTEYRQWAAKAAIAKNDGNEKDEKNFKSKMAALKVTLPTFNAWTRLEGGRTKECIRGYRNCMMVDIDHVDKDHLPNVEERMKEDPHVVMAYVTVSGCGVRAIVRMKGPVDERNYNDAWLTANEYMEHLTGMPYDPKCSDPTRLSAMCHDPRAVYRPRATPMKILSHTKSKHCKGRHVKTETAAKMARTLVEKEGITYGSGTHNDYVSRVLYWMNRFGIAQQAAQEWAQSEFADYNADNGHPIKAMTKSIYTTHADQFNTCRPQAYAEQKTVKATIGELEAYISDHYRMRRNVFTQTVEYIAVKKDTADNTNHATKPWTDLDDNSENSIWCAMLRDGLKVTMQTLHSLIMSDFVKDYHPLRQYLAQLPPWDGVTDHIGRLLAMVHCKDTPPEKFDYYVRRWLVAMLASGLYDNVVNHEIFVLLGPQGTFKSSFMNNLLPPCLRRYYTTKTNSQRMTKDDSFAMAENLLINLEEINSMQRQEVNQLKAMTTQTFIKDRPAYGRNKVRLPHVASFCATGNNMQMLTDETGSRRWLIFEVEHIDNPWTEDICHDGVYAQAKAMLDGGFKYWFEANEVEELNRRNTSFEAPNMARELIATHYELPAEDPEISLYQKKRYLTSSQIVMRFGNSVRLNAIQVGRAMIAMGFRQIRTANGRFWEVVETDLANIGSTLPKDHDR